MKKSELFFSALQVPVDYVMIVFAGIVAYALRFNSNIQELRPVLFEEEIGFRQYVEISLAVATFFVLIYAVDGLYDIRATKRTLRESYRVFRATAIGLMVIIVVIFVDRELFSSRFIILGGGVFIVIFVSLGRVALGSFQRFLLRRKGIGVHRLLLVGTGSICSSIKRKIGNSSDKGFMIVGHIDKIDLQRIGRIRKIKGVDELIHCTPVVDRIKLLKLKEYCMHSRIGFQYVPTLLQTSNLNLKVFLGEPIIEIKNTPLDGWGKIIKRIFDIVGAFVGLMIFGIPMIFISFAIWLESGSPIVFWNERVGHKGLFDLYKFRYMKNKYCHGKQYSDRHNKEALKYLEKLIAKQSIKAGPIYKIKNDPRRTKVGAILEKFSLDEFPQFFNVLKGRMSLVGPRPHQPIEVNKYEDYQKRVLTIKPGITGMAQISGRSDLEFKDEVRLDTYYIENWSILLDVQIILKTVPSLIRNRKN